MTLMNRPKTIFMGTSEFAVPVLQALHQNEYDICLVVSQPDRPRGRHLKTVATPTKNLAEKLGLQLFQPEKLCRSVCMEKIVNLHPDIIITAAYGQILTKKFLAIPRYGVLNVHASLLPLYRGPAPIQAAIIAGEKTTGVTIMLTEFSVDSGPILTRQAEAIHPLDTAGTLQGRLAKIGAELLIKTIPGYISGEISPQEQDHSKATFTRRYTSDDGWINWHQSAEQVANHVRGMNPCPGAFTSCGDMRLKITSAYPFARETVAEVPGTIVDVVRGKGILIMTGYGLLLCEDLQPACRKQMKGDMLIYGRYAALGDVLGSSLIDGDSTRCFDPLPS